MYREMLIQEDDDQVSVALVEEGRLAEIYLERGLDQGLVGSVFKGRVENVLPGIQASFVDIGLEKNAFLYIEDIQAKGLSPNLSSGRRPDIGDLLKAGQELLVQVVKDPMGTKGPRVTTHLTLPGRYLVLRPTFGGIALSRRITDAQERERLKNLVAELQPEAGVIVRTAAVGVSAEELRRDLERLIGLWDRITSRSANTSAPRLIHRELDLLSRALRDYFTENVDRVLVNSRAAYDQVVQLVETFSPQLRHRVYLEEKDLFQDYDVFSEIKRALKRKVWLKSGGYIVIEEVEALTVIDVNTGKYVGSTDLEDTVLKTNLEAVEEIVHQLRLRDIGGIIIIDFIDMITSEHREMVIRALEKEVSRDKTKTNILGLTQLGLVEMTRKKTRSGLGRTLLRSCPYCEGSGRVLAEDTVARQARRDILELAQRSPAPVVVVEAHPDVAANLQGSGGSRVRELEKKTGRRLVIKERQDLHRQEVRLNGVYSQEDLEDTRGEKN